jgi:hypothetical protein
VVGRNFGRAGDGKLHQLKRHGGELLMMVDYFLLEARLDAMDGDRSQRSQVEVEEVEGIVEKSKKM